MINDNILYTSGMSLIMEGDTEKYFYEEILNRICIDNEINLTKAFDDDELSNYYILSKNDKNILIKIKNAETITQITNQFLWFKNFCADKYSHMPWDVFLCYDTDGNSFLTFTQLDWKTLRDNINQISNVNTIVDCCADRDVEDLFLIDMEGIKRFLNINEDVKVEDLKGRKGKIKLKNLYMDYTINMRYHEGKRALSLIQSLDLRKIIEHPDNNIDKLEKLIINKLDD